MRRLALFLALAVAAPAGARTAAEVVLGAGPQDCDCPRAVPTAAPSPAPTVLASPVPTAAPSPAPSPIVPVSAAAERLRQEIQTLGFPVQWEAPDLMLVTLSDETTRFDKGRALLKPESVQRLKALAGVMQRYPGNRLSVSGHTDAGGKHAFNQALSQRRAQVVRDALVDLGVAADAFDAVEGFASDKPVGDNATDEGRAQNRRVEIRLRFHDLGPAPAPAAAPAQPQPLSPPAR